MEETTQIQEKKEEVKVKEPLNPKVMKDIELDEKDLDIDVDDL